VKIQVRRVLLTVLSGVVIIAEAGATTINFDNLSDGTQVTNQYAGVTFSSSGGDVVLITAQNPPYTGSAPNLICTGTIALPVGTVTVDCTHDLIMQFTNPVDNLTFNAFGNQSPLGSTFAQADVYQNNVLTHADINMIVTHASHTQDCPVGSTTPDCDPDPQDFSAFPGITELIIHNNTDINGTAYDDLNFVANDPKDFPIDSPEPASLSLMGFGGFLWATSRFLAARKSR